MNILLDGAEMESNPQKSLDILLNPLKLNNKILKKFKVRNSLKKTFSRQELVLKREKMFFIKVILKIRYFNLC